MHHASLAQASAHIARIATTAEHDSKNMLELAASTRSDSRTMKLVAVISMLYLPGTFVAVRHFLLTSALEFCVRLVEKTDFERGADSVQYELHRSREGQSRLQRRNPRAQGRRVICRHYGSLDGGYGSRDLGMGKER